MDGWTRTVNVKGRGGVGGVNGNRKREGCEDHVPGFLFGLAILYMLA